MEIRTCGLMGVHVDSRYKRIVSSTGNQSRKDLKTPGPDVVLGDWLPAASATSEQPALL